MREPKEVHVQEIHPDRAVTNPVEVTEVYVRQSGTWKPGSLSFTRLLR